MGRGTSAKPHSTSRGGGRTSLGPRAGAVRGRGSGRGRKPLNDNYIKKGLGALGSRGINKEDNHALEAKLGFPLFTAGENRLGWLININATTKAHPETGQIVSAVNCYFMCQDGSMFKAQVEFFPYFYIHCKDGKERDVETFLHRKYEGSGHILDATDVLVEDLELKNHVSGLKRRLLKVTCRTPQDLTEVARDLQYHVRRNKRKNAVTEVYDQYAGQSGNPAKPASVQGAMEHLLDLREADVPFHIRFCIDEGVRCGQWYEVRAQEGRISLKHQVGMLKRAEPRICAFDIETTKLPLQFPNAEHDQVFMISYMLDQQGYLIVNREIVGADICDFEFTPKPEFEGPFIVWNEPDEAATLRRWFNHMQEAQPAIYVTYNGDFFDWPFIQRRAEMHGLEMLQEVGFSMQKDTCLSRFGVHMDCLHWVNRDSYLPQGSRGLKSVTKEKLGYNPIEVDPEDMIRFAAEQPQRMASYSVCDAVSTYYLYMSYIHPFIFSLATVIPMQPDEVLRKGSGTLCEMLLMVEAYKAKVVAPNKHTAATEKMHEGRLLHSETYIGGKVEALQSGVFRSDLPVHFKCEASAYQDLIASLDDDLRYAIAVEGKLDPAEVLNYEEVRDSIRASLEALRDQPVRDEAPLIYHLDVGAMYPNIILTNRLQPSAMTTDEACAACSFNVPGKNCVRKMKWVWRGETFTADAAEYFSVKGQLEAEALPPERSGGPPRGFYELPPDQRSKLLVDRLKKYCQKVYKRAVSKPVVIEREAIVCMRENDFYVNTVRAFRDRRYEYKAKNKYHKNELDAAKARGDAVAVQEAADMVVLYDSLQLAHKCILNSFYGYVMRPAARWYSMEMAGVVTNTGAEIIKRAADLVTKLGMPLELDTDGIWCALPGSFPENYTFRRKTGRDFSISYPCVILNVMVAKHFTNDQYQELIDPVAKKYETSSQMSIMFEVDGPYKAMILPAAREEGKSIKKRYAVYNADGSLAELKGFELKRRGELKLIKVFQAEVFDKFLEGTTLRECYEAVASVANRWLDLLDTKGGDVDDGELLSYISESSTMSKSVEEYQDRKSAAITTARRLAEFLGDARIKDKGLNCNYIIAKRPESKPVSERAIPVAICSTAPAVARSFLERWCGGRISGDGDGDSMPDIRDLLDWDYYKERLGFAIQKIITIPAAMQKVLNPVPRVSHPDWLRKLVREKDDPLRQRKLDSFFAPAAGTAEAAGGADIEDVGRPVDPAAGRDVTAAVSRRQASIEDQENVGDHHNERAPVQEIREAEKAEWSSYRDWLKQRKPRWRAITERRQKRKALVVGGKRRRSHSEITEAAPRGAGLQGFFRQQEAQVAAQHWQLIQLASTGEPGKLRAWVLVGSAMYDIPLRVSRVFYVDSLAAPGDDRVLDLGSTVRRILPMGAEPHNLYKVEIGEAEYLRKATDWALRLAQDHVKGVWEERVPIRLQAFLSLGCTTELLPAARSRPLMEGFGLSDFKVKSAASRSYLEGGDDLGALRQIALYHSRDALGRGVWAVHNTIDSRMVIIVITPGVGRTTTGVSNAMAEGYWKGYQEKLHADAADRKPIEADTTFKVSHEEALKALSRTLMLIRERHKGPLVVVLECPGGATWLSKEVPMLRDVPVIESSLHSMDSQYASIAWQPRAVEVAMLRTAQMPSMMKDQAEMARYVRLPLGNFGSDCWTQGADVLFARALREAGHLLWATDDALPDVAGRAHAELEAEEMLWNADLPAERVVPGAYRCICVRLDVHHLAVTAIEQSVVLNVLEGTGAAQVPETCGAAFRVLKGLVHRWLIDATLQSNASRVADRLLLKLWRWLCNSGAALASPALQRSVASLMRKVLAQLVSAIQRLGATVVAADVTSLIVATGKHTLFAAAGYVDYMLHALRKQELFSLLTLSPTVFWHSLLFRDRYNYLGVRAQLPEDIRIQMGTLSKDGSAQALDIMADLDSIEAGQQRMCDVDWNIQKFLPPAVQKAFLNVVMDFLIKPWEHTRPSPAHSASEAVSQAVLDAQKADEAQTAWLRTWMSESLIPRVLRIVMEIREHVLPGATDPQHSFPKLAGSHLSEFELGSPALAFALSVCEVLGLDSRVEEEIALLRSNLLTMLHVRECSPQAYFKEPCRTFVLRDVICSYCSTCCDLDLCRDPQIQREQWQCSKCQNRRDVGEVEARLVTVVRRATRVYLKQDLRCSKCHACAPAIAFKCQRCGGVLKATESPESWRRTLSVLRNIARYHKFTLLDEMAGWLLDTRC